MGFGAGVTRGPDVDGAPTMASRRCSSRSLIFLIASTPCRIGLKPFDLNHCATVLQLITCKID